MFYVRLLIVIYMWIINHSVDCGQFVIDINWGQLTCDYMLLFQIVCLLMYISSCMTCLYLYKFENKVWFDLINRHGFFSLCCNIWYFSFRHKLHWFDGLLFVVAWLIMFIIQYQKENNKQRYNKEKAVKPMQFMPRGKISKSLERIKQSRKFFSRLYAAKMEFVPKTWLLL